MRVFGTEFRRHLIVIVLYTALTLLMTVPVAGFLTTHVAGYGGDPWQTLWRFEEKEVLLKEAWDGPAPRGVQGVFYFIKDEFLGGGEARLVNLSVWPWMPLHMIFGQPAAYNLVWLLSFILSGYAMYCLVGYLTRWRSRQAAFLAGLFYMFLPFHVAHAMGHFGAMQTQWLPFIFLAVFSFVEKPVWWKGLAVIVLVTIQSWTEHHYLLWLFLWLIVFAIFFRKRLAGLWRERRTVILSGVTAAVVAVFVFMTWWPTVRLKAEVPESLVLGREQTIRYSANAMAWVTPAIWHPIWGGLSYDLMGRRFSGNVAEATQYLGIVPLLLVLLFYRDIPRRQRIFWTTVAGLFLLIALGPRLQVMGRALDIPLPYSLIDSWPVFSAVRTVGRAGALVGLSVALLLGWVIGRRLKGAVAGVALGGVILLEFMFLPVPIQSVRLSPVYEEAVAEAGGEALLEIPAATNYTASSRALYASHRHGKEVVGNIALERGAIEYYEIHPRDLPVTGQLLYMDMDYVKRADELDEEDVRREFGGSVCYLEAGAMMIQTDAVTMEQLAALRYFIEEKLRLEPWEFDGAVFYDLSDLVDECR